MPERAHLLLPLDSPFRPDPVLSPQVEYAPIRIVYEGHAVPWVRVTFDRWDSLRVCRGEYLPYDTDGSATSYTVSDSRWLRERHAYEAKHYGTSYSWGKNVDEMLEEFDHYLFRFHDEFVEVIAGGVWFEASATPFGDDLPVLHPPSAELPDAAIVERLEAHGIGFQIRKDPRPHDQLLEASRLSDQSLYQVWIELDGDASILYRLTLRTRDGTLTSRWRSSFGTVEQTFSRVPDLDEVRPLVAAYAHTVAEHRRKMGK
jgi:hypothetical protein